MNNREFLEKLCDIWHEKRHRCVNTPVSGTASRHYSEQIHEVKRALDTNEEPELLALRRFYTATDVAAFQLSESLPPEPKSVMEVGILLLAGKVCEWPPEETAKLCGEPVSVVSEYNEGKRQYWELQGSEFIKAVKTLHRFRLLRLPEDGWR